jgi:predicted RNA binding protein YcfA (HicA-like mRNA interferase family)
VHNRLRAVDARKVIQILQSFGFSEDRSKGSHHQWVKKSPSKVFRVTVISKAKFFKLETLKSMIRQSGHSEEEWVKALDES